MLFVKIPYLNADCEVLQDFANEKDFVRVTDMNEEENPYIFIEIYNIFHPYVYVEIEEDYNNTKARYDFNNIEDNYLSIRYTNLERSTNYKVKVYGNIDGCQDKLLRTVEFNTSTKNKYYDEDVCVSNREYERCSFFADNNDITLEELKEKINKYIEENKTKEEDEEDTKENNFFKNILDKIKLKYVLYAVIPMVIIGVFFGIRLIILKRRSKK